jgi:hypothetical protein
MGLTDNIRGARQFCNVRTARSTEIFATIPNHHYLPMILDSFALHAWCNLKPQIILDGLRKQVLNRVPSLANGSELLCWDNQVSNFSIHLIQKTLRQNLCQKSRSIMVFAFQQCYGFFFAIVTKSK